MLGHDALAVEDILNGVLRVIFLDDRTWWNTLRDRKCGHDVRFDVLIMSRAASEDEVWSDSGFELADAFEGAFALLGRRCSRRAKRTSAGTVRGRSRVLAAHGCRSTDHFAGFQITGKFDASDITALIRSLPEGSTEFMCHPGLCTAELRAARTRLKESREQELRALTAPEVRDALRESGVELVDFTSLTGLRAV